MRSRDRCSGSRDAPFCASSTYRITILCTAVLIQASRLATFAAAGRSEPALATAQRRTAMKGMSGLLLAALLLCGCTAAQHRAAVRDDTIRGISVGTVQREIHMGMSGADVIAAIGPPNIVSTDAERNEVWVYDKLATDVVYSSSDGGVLALIF